MNNSLENRTLKENFKISYENAHWAMRKKARDGSVLPEKQASKDNTILQISTHQNDISRVNVRKIEMLLWKQESKK